MTDDQPTRTTRAQRMAMPLAREVVQDLAVEHGACIRPIQLRRTNLDTGEVDQVLVPCGHTLATSARPAPNGPGRCGRRNAGKAGTSRTNPTLTPDPATDDQQWWIETARRSPAAPRPGRERRAGHRPTWTSSSPSWTRRSPTRGCAGTCSRPGRRGGTAPPGAARMPRTCPAARSARRTVGKTYTAPDGKTFRPSMFVTLTCPSYGRVREDGTPADPGSYDYDRAARDALPFAALFDRFIQNLRRYLGYDVQYFAAVEPQRRLAPHIHIAIRGTVVPRRAAPGAGRDLPPGLVARRDRGPSTTATSCRVWDEQAGTYVDPATGEVLPTWDEALDAISAEDEPLACGPVRGPVRRPGRARRLQGRRPVHRLPDQVPRPSRSPTATRPRPTRSGHMPPGWPRRCAISRARRGARTGSGTASSPRTPGPAWSPAAARAKPTTPITSATPGGGSWSPASGPARRWPTTAPTARTGCCATLGVSATDPARYAWEPVAPATPTTWTTPGGCCTPSPTGPMAGRTS